MLIRGSNVIFAVFSVVQVSYLCPVAVVVVVNNDILTVFIAMSI